MIIALIDRLVLINVPKYEDIFLTLVVIVVHVTYKSRGPVLGAIPPSKDKDVSRCYI